MNNLIFYIDTTKPAIQNPVASITNTSTDTSNLHLVGGDRFDVMFQFVSNGAIQADMASDTLSYHLGIGYAGATDPFFSSSNFYVSQSHSVSCSLDLISLTGSLINVESINPYIQLQVANPSGSENKRTYLLRKVTVYSPVDL